MLIYLLIKVDFYLIITIVNKIDFNLYAMKKHLNYIFKYFFPSVRYHESKFQRCFIYKTEKEDKERQRE